MSYEKQTWKEYNDELTEEQNIQVGAVVTAERMNHLETGLEEHDKNKSNPHQVTKEQIELGNVTNVEQASKIDLNSHKNDKTNPHNVTKAQVGLSNVVNVEQASKTDFLNHTSNKTNPHGVTKNQINLGNVDNYMTATVQEAEAGLSTNKFMTPALVFKAIAKWVQGKFVTPEDLLDKTYPIGAIYPSVSSVNPELLFGGTWERFAKGQVLVGANESDGDFAAGKAGGTKAHKLTINELPKHTVPLGLNRGPNPSASGSGTGGYLWGDVASGGKNSGSVGGDQPHNNLQPYIAVYMWKRIA